MLVGPIIGQVSFMREDWRLWRGHRDPAVAAAWLVHIPAVALVVWVVSLSSFKRSNGSGSLTMKLKKDKSETTRERARRFELGSVPDVANAEKILRDARKRAKDAAKS